MSDVTAQVTDVPNEPKNVPDNVDGKQPEMQDTVAGEKGKHENNRKMDVEAVPEEPEHDGDRLERYKFDRRYSHSRSASKKRSTSPKSRRASRSRSRSRNRRRGSRSWSRDQGGRDSRPTSRYGSPRPRRSGGNNVYMRPTREPEEGSKLHVGNLSYQTDVAELEYHFTKYGKLSDVYIPMDNYAGRSKGFAFVTFEDSRDAMDALRDLDGTEVDGRRISVEKAKPRRGGGRRGGGYGYGGRRSRGSSYDRDRRRESRRERYRSDSRGRSPKRYRDDSCDRRDSRDRDRYNSRDRRSNQRDQSREKNDVDDGNHRDN